jgi:hypothetical protein
LAVTNVIIEHCEVVFDSMADELRKMLEMRRDKIGQLTEQSQLHENNNRGVTVSRERLLPMNAIAGTELTDSVNGY